MALRRRDPYRHLPPPPMSDGRPALSAAAPPARAMSDVRLAAFVTPDAALVTREAAWSVPAVSNALQLIAGTIGTLPLERRQRLTHELVTVETTFLDQLDPVEPTSATLTRVIEDLVLWPAAHLVVVSRFASGFPAGARYVPFEAVAPPGMGDDHYRITVDAETFRVPPWDVIRIPSHWPGLLTVGGRTIATALALEGAARRMADADLPAGILKNRGADLTDTEIAELQAGFDRARHARSVPYLNAQLDFEPVQWDAAQLGLVDGRDHEIAELARLLNLPSKYLNAPTTTAMTYQNLESARRDLLDLSLRPYVVALEGRLTMADVTPRTQYVRVMVDDFLRGAASERIDVAAKRIDAGITSPAEERAAEHIPGPPPAPAPPPTPAPVADTPPALTEGTPADA